mgnify:FL=1
MSIGKKIRELRLEHNLLQRELAKEIHIAPNTLSQFETGQANPSYEVLSLIADFFQCSTGYLLGREDDFGNVVVQTEKPAPLPQDEQELLNIYQALSPAHRSQILEYARYFAEKSGAATRRKA